MDKLGAAMGGGSGMAGATGKSKSLWKKAVKSTDGQELFTAMLGMRAMSEVGRCKLDPTLKAPTSFKL